MDELICGVPVCTVTEGTRPYAVGRRCDTHKPGPEPGGRSCAPNRCYCGRCPSYIPLPADPRVPAAPVATPAADTVTDTRAIAAGKRRSTPEQYRAARGAA
jgi:hypothetical protein